MTLTGSSSLAAWVGFLLWALTLAGPVIGAVVDRAPHRGAGVALLDAGTFFAAAALCLLIKPGPIIHEPATEPWRARIADGARLLRTHHELRLILAAGAVAAAVTAALCLRPLRTSPASGTGRLPGAPATTSR
jgi:hypothetical protein